MNRLKIGSAGYLLPWSQNNQTFPKFVGTFTLLFSESKLHAIKFACFIHLIPPIPTTPGTFMLNE